MSRTLVKDAHANPELFDLRLPVLKAEIDGVEQQLGGRLPPSYRGLLQAAGQGVMFDNESLLGVHETSEGLGDLVSVNREMREKQGLPDHLVVFHLGTAGIHAFDTSSREDELPVVELDEDSLAPGRTYEDLDEWYTECIRPEYRNLTSLDSESPESED